MSYIRNKHNNFDVGYCLSLRYCNTTLATRMAGCSECLPPPSVFLALPGEPPVPWFSWISSFKTYLIAAGLENVPQERERALLLHYLGAEGQRVLGTLGHAQTFGRAVALLNAHYAIPKGILLNRVIFRHRHQGIFESVTQFAADLGRLASVCRYGALQDEMIRDQLILHLNYESTRQRLLLENNDLTLTAALTIAVTFEKHSKKTALDWLFQQNGIIVFLYIPFAICVLLSLICCLIGLNRNN